MLFVDIINTLALIETQYLKVREQPFSSKSALNAAQTSGCNNIAASVNTGSKACTPSLCKWGSI